MLETSSEIAAGEVLGSSSAFSVADTDWHTDTATYAVVYDRPLVVRVRGCGGNTGGTGAGQMYWWQVIEVGTTVNPGEASFGAVLLKTTGATARGGSGTCAKLTPPAGAVLYGYWDFYVPVTAAASTLTLYWAKSAAGFDGLLKVSVWDSDDPFNATPELAASHAVDITAADTDYHVEAISLAAAAAAGLCRVRIELKDGATSGYLLLDDISVAVT